MFQIRRITWQKMNKNPCGIIYLLMSFLCFLLKRMKEGFPHSSLVYLYSWVYYCLLQAGKEDCWPAWILIEIYLKIKVRKTFLKQILEGSKQMKKCLPYSTNSKPTFWHRGLGELSFLLRKYNLSFCIILKVWDNWFACMAQQLIICI